jgi:hypothetical protein
LTAGAGMGCSAKVVKSGGDEQAWWSRQAVNPVRASRLF